MRVDLSVFVFVCAGLGGCATGWQIGGRTLFISSKEHPLPVSCAYNIACIDLCQAKLIGASLSEPHPTLVGLHCGSVLTYVHACLRPYTVNFKYY